MLANIGQHRFKVDKQHLGQIGPDQAQMAQIGRRTSAEFGHIDQNWAKTLRYIAEFGPKLGPRGKFGQLWTCVHNCWTTAALAGIVDGNLSGHVESNFSANFG